MGVLTLPLLVLLAQAEPPPTPCRTSGYCRPRRRCDPARRPRARRRRRPGTALRRAHAPRQDRPHLGAGPVNGQGPFRLVLDTGASHYRADAAARRRRSASEADPTADGHAARRHRLRARADVPVETLEFGDFLMEPQAPADRAGRARRRRGRARHGRARGQAHPHRLPPRQHHDHALEEPARGRRVSDDPGELPARAPAGRGRLHRRRAGEGHDRHGRAGDARQRGAARRAGRASPAPAAGSDARTR